MLVLASVSLRCWFSFIDVLCCCAAMCCRLGIPGHTCVWLCCHFPLSPCGVGSPLTLPVVPVQQCPMSCERQDQGHLRKSKVVTDSPPYSFVWVFLAFMLLCSCFPLSIHNVCSPFLCSNSLAPVPLSKVVLMCFVVLLHCVSIWACPLAHPFGRVIVSA